MLNSSRLTFTLLACGLLIAVTGLRAQAQTTVGLDTAAKTPTVSTGAPADGPKVDRASGSDAERINTLEETLRQQANQIDELRKLLLEQQAMLRLLAGKSTAAGTVSTGEPLPVAPANAGAPVKAVSPPSQVEERLKKVESRISELGGLKFSGDIRLRAESFFGLSNSLASGANPAVLGNELTPRHRMRIRARLAVRGSIGQEFDWGLRFTTGSFADNISTNQTLTDFFNRKPFGLDQAYITYKPRQVPGLRLQGGKFEPPWTYTEMTFDNDLMVEGFNESYSRKSRTSKLKDLTFIAWQLPFLERNSAFVRNSNGTVNTEQSRRGGRDLALYGGQIRARLEPSSKVALNLSVSDLYFHGTQFISPVQVFGSQLQLPVTITIPATATTPAQTVTTQVSVPRDLLTAGHGNLGLTTATNNATNRDGRLSSGFNLVDVIGRLELKHNQRFPVALLFNFVTNTRTRDVVLAGPGGTDRVLPNKENNGFWGEVQVGQTKERGDMLFGYTYMHIEKDAVLTPFNFSDITQQSDVRGHRFNFAYAADPRVTFALTGVITRRPHGLFGAFGTTPDGSLNRPTTRLQFDTILKF
jgi:hypothetical protein